MAEFDGGLFGIVGGAALMLPASVVVAADYLTIDAAQRALFPDADSFDPVIVSLTLAERDAVTALAGPQPQRGTLRVWRAISGATIGWVLVDEVIGRSDLITYAVGITHDGTLRSIEILAYRESHGGEIRNAAWRRQFADRKGLAELQFRTDIKNISGATLSSEHVTQGVRWLVALWQVALRNADVSP